MGWLAVLAGLAYGLNAAISARAIRSDPDRTRTPTGGAWASLAFAILAVPAMFMAAGAAQASPIVVIATGICALGVAGVGLDAFLRAFASRLPVGVDGLKSLYAIGFLGFHVWVAILSVAILVGGALPAGLGWLGIVSIGGFVAGVALSMSVPEADWGHGRAWFVSAFAPQAGVAVWMIWLGLSL